MKRGIFRLSIKTASGHRVTVSEIDCRESAKRELQTYLSFLESATGRIERYQLGIGWVLDREESGD